jgi:hypothetical protein
VLRIFSQCVDVLQNDMRKLKLEADMMWKQLINSMVPEITLVVKFCKKLPGNSERLRAMG